MKKRPALILGLLVVAFLVMLVLSPKDKAPDSVSETTEVTEEKETPESKTEVPPPSTIVIAAGTTENSTSLQLELSEALQTLPTLEEISDLKEEEVHHTPEIVMNAGTKIGELITAANDEPTRREETAKFFLSCAEDEDVVASIRALCWKSLTRKIPEWKVFVPIAEAKVPMEIQALSERAD